MGKNQAEYMYAYNRAYYRANKERILAQTKAYRLAHVDQNRNARLQRQYALTLVEFDRLLAEQNGQCAICGTDKPGRYGRFCVDHDHRSGKVRGLLCHNCNHGVGKFKDSAARLNSAAAYLRRHEAA